MKEAYTVLLLSFLFLAASATRHVLTSHKNFLNYQVPSESDELILADLESNTIMKSASLQDSPTTATTAEPSADTTGEVSAGATAESVGQIVSQAPMADSAPELATGSMAEPTSELASQSFDEPVTGPTVSAGAESSTEEPTAASTMTEQLQSVIEQALAPEQKALEKAVEIPPAPEVAAPPPIDNRSVFRRLVDFVGRQLSSRAPVNSNLSSSLNNNTSQEVLPPPPPVQVSYSVQLGTGISASDFYRVAELVAPTGLGTITYHESRKNELGEESGDDTSEAPPDEPDEFAGSDEVSGLETEEQLPEVPFDPQGRTEGQYEENETKELDRALLTSPFTQDYFRENGIADSSDYVQGPGGLEMPEEWSDELQGTERQQGFTES